MKEYLIRCINAGGWSSLETSMHGGLVHIKETGTNFWESWRRFGLVYDAPPVQYKTLDKPPQKKKPVTEGDTLQEAINRTMDLSMQPQAMWHVNGFRKY